MFHKSTKALICLSPSKACLRKVYLFFTKLESISLTTDVMTTPQEVLQLYRHIFRAAKRFPSIKRDKIVQDIRSEFRENKYLSDVGDIEDKVKVAVRSLDQLVAYTKRDTKSTEWSVNLKGSCD